MVKWDSSRKSISFFKRTICIHRTYQSNWLDKTKFSLLDFCEGKYFYDEKNSMLASPYSYFHLSENKTINVFPIDYIVQLSKVTSQWVNKYLTLRVNK